MLEKTDVIAKITEAKNKIAEYRKVIADIGGEAVRIALGPLFDQSPNATVRWTQYTPHWNDGESCEFRSNHDYPDVDGCEGEYWKIVTGAMDDFDDDFMRLAFGEEIEVTVSKDGVSIEGYDHD